MTPHSDSSHAELVSLCGIARDDSLTAGQFARLEEILAESAEARAFYVQFFQLDAWLARHSSEADVAAQEIGPDLAELTREICSENRAGHSMQAAGSRWAPIRRRAAQALALAASLLAAWWFFRDSEPPIVAERESQTIASLTHSTDAQWQAGYEPSDGERLTEGQSLSLLHGRAQVSMSCGAELVLKGPCSIVMTSPNQVLLRDGLISVQVADWTEDFTIATATIHIVDLGKQFVVSADSKSGTVEAHAIDGKLRVQAVNSRGADREQMLVSTGEAIRVSPASKTSTRLPANGTLFDRGIGNARPFKPLELHNTGRDLEPGDEDPYWRITSSSADDIQVPRQARVSNYVEGAYLPNDANVSQWISIEHPLGDNSPPFAMYTFETEVDLTGYDLSTVTLVAQVIADNGVSSIRINGNAVTFKPWMYTGYHFRTFRNIEIASGFVEGINKIEFDVWNGPYEGRHDAYNPIAFRVEWQAFGRLKADSARVLPREASNGAGLQLERLALIGRDRLPRVARGGLE